MGVAPAAWYRVRMVIGARARAGSGALRVAGAAAGLACLAGGCIERKISITSEPPGAVCWVNDVEIGRTPVETEFTFYGEYDVRLRLEGYEPLRTHAAAEAPLHEYPPFDFFATIAPFDFDHTVKWHFVLEKRPEEAGDPRAAERELIERARDLRQKVEPPRE